MLTQSMFNQAEFEKAVVNTNTYRCGGNALWACVRTSTDVPVNKSKVEMLKKNYFDKPTVIFPFTVEFAILEANGTPKVDTLFGHLDMISPEEVVHAVIFRIAEDIDQGRIIFDFM